MDQAVKILDPTLKTSPGLFLQILESSLKSQRGWCAIVVISGILQILTSQPVFIKCSWSAPQGTNLILNMRPASAV